MKIKVKRNHFKAIITGCLLIYVAVFAINSISLTAYADELGYSVTCQCGTTISISPENNNCSNSVNASQNCTQNNCNSSNEILSVSCPTCGKVVATDNVTKVAIESSDNDTGEGNSIYTVVAATILFGMIVLTIMFCGYVYWITNLPI